MMTQKEKQLYEHWKSLSWDEYYKESLAYNFEEFSDEFNKLIKDDIMDKAFEDTEPNNTSFEESLQRAFDSWTKEEQEAFLNEDWSEFDYEQR